MCGDGKQAFRDPDPQPRTAEELYSRKKEHIRTTDYMEFIRDNMR